MNAAAANDDDASRLVVERLRAGPLSNFGMRLGPGLHVVLGRESEGTRELVSVVVGSSAPRSGTVRIAGRDPRRSPDLRRRVAVLCAEELVFPSKTVREAVQVGLEARGIAASAEQALAAARLQSFGSRNPRTLSGGERRSVAAAIAFCIEKPLVAALHEPLAYLPGIPPSEVTARIARWLEQGACVLCTTSSPRAAHALGGVAWLLDHGQLVRRIAAADAESFAPKSAAMLRVRTPTPRELVARLADHPEVSALILDEGREPNEVGVKGPDPAALALAVCQAALDNRITITAIHPVLPALDVTYAASAGELRGAFDAAYRAAFEPHREERPA